MKLAVLVLIVLMAWRAFQWAYIDPCTSAVLTAGAVLSLLLLQAIEVLERLKARPGLGVFKKQGAGVPIGPRSSIPSGPGARRPGALTE